MQALFNAVRESCSAQAWSQGVQLTRADAVQLIAQSDDEAELRVTTPTHTVSPVVTLYLEDEDWSCQCDDPNDVCPHVAAAVIALRRAKAEGTDLREPNQPTATITYNLKVSATKLKVERLLTHGEQTHPIQTSIALVKRNILDGENLIISEQDLAFEAKFGLGTADINSRQQITKLFATLTGAPSVTLKGNTIELGKPLTGMEAIVEDHPDGAWVRLQQDPGVDEIFANGALRIGNSLHALADTHLTGDLLQSLKAGKLYKHHAYHELVTTLLPQLQAVMTVHQKVQSLPDVTNTPPRLNIETERDGDALSVLATLVYGEPPNARIDGDKLVHLGGPVPVRDREAERVLTRRLQQDLGLAPGMRTRLKGMAAITAADAMGDWEGTVDGNAQQDFFLTPELEPTLNVDQADFGFRVSGQQGQSRQSGAAVDGRDVLRAWQAGESLVPIMGGGWAPVPSAWLARYGQQVADLLAAKDATGQLPTCALPDLARLCEVLEEPLPPEFEALENLTRTFESIPTAAHPKDLTATLRHYQEEGVNWLTFAQNAKLGALLADDMGLGKTLQAITIIRGRTLVVAPTSVLHNWVAEIKKFRPQLSSQVYHGGGRELSRDADVVITTYAVMRLDIDLLCEETWDAVILDEAQAIKNPQSQVSQAAFQLNATFRVSLSGTPIENRLDELWSQMHFLNPGLLGGRSDFEKRYTKPIIAGDEAVVAHLQERIRPFILRRLKSEVATELPPRTEVVLHCRLSDEEREVYNVVRASTQESVAMALEAGGNVLSALEALLRLRQAACHPALLPGQVAQTSAKVELLVETLEEAIAEGHKSLVFSQWTSLLDLIEPIFKARQIEFTRLDGSTRDRGAVVDSFQNANGPPVMLISLKAGGTGLNLTAADHVFILDPWWNPAVEAQAADRAHRIGQDKPVIVHKLVSEDTVEEGILELQNRKKELADVAMAQAGKAAQITRDDLLTLLGSA